ncbi:hypothetical protein B0H13DRAFT_2577262 [Mycena leptocephala]|nr:hypothetical protein B0H13DRAFT_2577262 [Mycena leptocephala]
MATFRTICPRCGGDEKQPSQLRGTKANAAHVITNGRGSATHADSGTRGLPMHERRGRRAAGSDGDDNDGCEGDRERRPRALCMAVALWSSGVWGRSCAYGSPGRRRRAEVGRGVRRGNDSDAGEGVGDAPKRAWSGASGGGEPRSTPALHMRLAVCTAGVKLERRSQAADTRRRPRDRPSSYAARVGVRCERRAEMVEQSTVEMGYIERPEGLEQY